VGDWDAGPQDDEAGAVIKTVARQLKLWREAAGLTQAEFGAAIGYGEKLVSSVERGRRIPRPEYLDQADEALGANGKIIAMKRDLTEVRYPKKVRDLKKLEEEAVELCNYNNSVIHGLLQTEEYVRASFATRRPPSGRTNWNSTWPPGWPGRRSSAERQRRSPYSASSNASRRCAAPSGAEW
jgi:transcriptional regulator with XRE-family HTH domain